METIDADIVLCYGCHTNINYSRSFLGIWAYKNKWVEATLNPVLNVMQTMPHYAYLVPITVLFGIGDHAGAIATIIFATPPMVRLTLLGLRKVPAEVIEA